MPRLDNFSHTIAVDWWAGGVCMGMEAVMEEVGQVTSVGFDRYVADRAAELWYAARLLTGDDHHAEDLVQTALSKTYAKYDTFDN